MEDRPEHFIFSIDLRPSRSSFTEWKTRGFNVMEFP